VITEPIAEPQPRVDGCCLVCEKPITTVNKWGEADAFCTSRCCRSFFGTQLEVDVDPPEKSVLSQQIQAAKT
jgi:hypothetical protein